MVCSIGLHNSISLYIHIPFCISKCDYCDFFSVPCKNISDEYIIALCKEIDFRFGELKRINPELQVTTIYIGGGTPSLLSANQMEKISACFKRNFLISKVIEFTIEVNPDDVSIDLLKKLESLGVNRISCGIQSMNNDSLKCVNRRADQNQNLIALNLLKKYWKKNLSLDLIAGLPFETEESFLNGIKTVLDVNPQHVSLYTLTVEEGTSLFNKIESNTLEYDFDFSDKLWILGRDLLLQNGFNHYEVSNFSKINFECKHNMSYWQHKNYIGCGCGATGTVYNKSFGFRWTNKQNVNDYINYWNSKNYSKIFFNLESFLKNDFEVFSEECENKIQNVELIMNDDSEFEFFMMGLRTKDGINSIDYENIFGKKLNKKFCSIINKWNENGMADIKCSGLNINYSLNENGLLFLNKFLEELLD